MLPILTFASGIIAGALGVRWIKKSKAPAQLTTLARKARDGFDKAGEELRDVTASGLSAVEKSTASLRAKLAGQTEPPAAEPAHPVDAPAGSGKKGHAQEREK